MMISGLQKTTLLDFPEKVACTVFTAGCNLRCPFCHNASLVLRANEQERISEEEFFSFLSKRRGILDGVCITGGEPLLQKDIIPFMERIQSHGFLIKLDTNGFYPEVLEEILEKHLVNYVAMDIKNQKEKYALTCGVPVDLASVSRSIDLLMMSDVDYEFRTTVVRELHSATDMEEIAKWISGAKHYFLQSFKDSGDIIGNGMSAYSEEELENILLQIRKHVPVAMLRGVS